MSNGGWKFVAPGSVLLIKGSRLAETETRVGCRNAVAIAKASLVLLLMVGVIEVTLRFGLGLGNPVLIQVDSACSYTLKPEQSVVRFFARTHTNQFGMRSDEVAVAPNNNGLRLLFLGDSITYGTSRVDQEKIFTEVLHRELPSLVHRPVEVLNASASAWAPANELEYLQSRGVFDANIVFLVLNDGDLAQPRSVLNEVRDELPEKRPSTAIAELLTRFVRPRVFGILPQVEPGDGIQSSVDETVRQNLENVDAMRVFANARRASFILIYVPFRRDIPGEGDRVAMTLHNWSAARGVTMLDLSKAEGSHSIGEITLNDGIHFNAVGHRVIAQAIEEMWPRVAESQ